MLYLSKYVKPLIMSNGNTSVNWTNHPRIFSYLYLVRSNLKKNAMNKRKTLKQCVIIRKHWGV